VVQLEYELVFAGNAEEVSMYRARHGLSSRQARFVKDLLDLQGFRFDPPINMPLIGTFWMRLDAHLLYDAAKSRGIIPTPPRISPLSTPPPDSAA